MKSFRKNSLGFAHIGLILLALLIIATIVGVGYYVMKQNDNSPSAAISSQQKDTANTPAESTKFLEIKEWNVKLPLSGPVIQDAIYQTPFTVDGRQVESTRLSTTAAHKMQCTNSETGEKSPLGFQQGALMRAKDVDTLAKSTLQPRDAFVHIGEYYYAYQPSTGIGSCDLNEVDQNLQSKINGLDGFAGVWQKLSQI